MGDVPDHDALTALGNELLIVGMDMAVPGSDATFVTLELHEYERLTTRIAELEAERAELVKDRDRLDWLEGKYKSLYEVGYGNEPIIVGWEWKIRNNNDIDIRQAIDAAREGE